MMHLLPFLLLLVCLFKPCSVKEYDDLSCSVKGTMCAVPEFNGHDCLITWSNGSDHMLAFCNETLDTPSEVAAGWYTATTFRAKKCDVKLLYMRTCVSEETKHSATCTVPCVEEPDDADHQNITRTKTNRDRWVIGLTVAAVAAVAAVIVFLVFRFKKNRNPSDNAVRMQDRPQDEEEAVGG